MTTQRPRTSKRSRNGVERWLPAPPADATGSTPDPVRWSKVLSAQARIASGYYERDEIRECVVNALLEEMDKR